MYNDVKQRFPCSNVHCDSCSHERTEMNTALYFPIARNLNGGNTDMCTYVAGPLSKGSGDLFKLSYRSNETVILLFPPLLAQLAAIVDLSVTSTPILPSGRVTSSCIRSITFFVVHQQALVQILRKRKTDLT